MTGENVTAIIIAWVLIVPLSILVGWNVGLENAGIVDQGIGWPTAFGLSVCLGLARYMLSAARSVTINTGDHS